MFRLYAGIGLLIVTSPAWAVLQSWEGGTGGLAAPSMQDAIEVSQARVELFGSGLGGDRLGAEWTTKVTLDLKGASGSPVAVVVPYQIHGEGMALNPPPEFDPKPGEPLLKQFEASWKGVAVKASSVPIKPTWGLPERGFTFGWALEFPMSDGRFSYAFRTGVTTHESGARWAQLAMGPAAVWKRFGATTLQVRPGVVTRTCRELLGSHPRLYSSLAGVEETPRGGRRVGKGASAFYQWELERLTGQEDLSFCFVSAAAHRRNLVRQLILQRSSFFQGQPKADLKRLRHLVYATYGMKFRSKALAQTFNKEWWYQSDPGFRFSQLTEGEKDLVRYLAKMERFAEK